MPRKLLVVRPRRTFALFLVLIPALTAARGMNAAEGTAAVTAGLHMHAHAAAQQGHDQPGRRAAVQDTGHQHAHAPDAHLNDSLWHRLQHWLIEALGGEHPHADDHDHDADPEEILTATRWTQDVELFLEHPPLVAGESAELLIFLTRLSDFSPLHRGRVTASLTPELGSEGHDSARGQPAAIAAEVAEPSRPGVYRLRLTPDRAGHHQLALSWADGETTARFALKVSVAQPGTRGMHADGHTHAPDHDQRAEHEHAHEHADADAHAHAHADADADDDEHDHEAGDARDHGHDHDSAPAGAHDHAGDSHQQWDHDHPAPAQPAAAGASVQLTKEQQWLSDFATAAVERRLLRGSVPATGVLRASADGDAHVTAPIDAHLRPAAGGFPYTGMQVAAGQTLAYLVPRLSGEADVAGLELAVTRAETALDLARQERERLDALWEDRSIPFREVLQARGDEDVAAAELSAARRRLAQIQRTEEGEGAGVPVRAPIGGVVARVEVAPGAFVEEGARLFHLVSPERLWLDARVAEADIGRIQTPVGAWFRVRGLHGAEAAGGGQVFVLTPATGARLVTYGAMVDPESRTVPVVLEFAPSAYDNGERLRVGQSVGARVYTGEASHTLVVPAGALVNDAGADVVYVQVGGDRFERRLVHTGLRDRDLVGVHDGVRLGERVVSRGAYLVHLAAGAEADAGQHHGHDH